MKGSIVFVIFIIIIFLGFVRFTQQEKYLIVHTNDGDVLGYQTEMAKIFYGIPYAKPPIDHLRYDTFHEHKADYNFRVPI